MSTYFLMQPSDIVRDIKNKYKNQTDVFIQDKKFTLLPGVYPSQNFRSSLEILHILKPLVRNKSICDMGCGMGIVGIFSMLWGAKEAVLVDINQNAVDNAALNRSIHNIPIEAASIYKSNVFESVPKQKFDYIVFNIPFHSDEVEIHEDLEYAFFDPCFKSLNKFLDGARSYMSATSEILVIFSDKGDTQTLEGIFDEKNYGWDLKYTRNSDQKFDTRVYSLKM